ncbi:MAG: threonylcarbamoyl-AMP synthase [Lachnospiraceae bacterium]|mgnify:CR=1 FL=1|nr:threonylcarbamoyl-AMP synthase [Lachnospiraceae bacterium]
METKIVRMAEEQIDMELIREAGKIIRDGGLVAFPTETVYGLGGDALNPLSSRKIYAAKGRPSDNPLIVHIADLQALSPIVGEIPGNARKLAERFWPGPLTMILHKSDRVPYETTGGLDTVAVRMPANRIAQEMIRAAGGYVAAPSANRSGRPSPTVARYVAEDLAGRVEMIIDGGDVEIGLESTIVDLTSDRPMVLRPGYITLQDLESVLSRVEEDRTLMEEDAGQAPKAPGMKYRHYAPKGEMTVIKGVEEQVMSYINERCREYRDAGRKTGVIATDETLSGYCADVCRSVGCRHDEEAIARELYRILREFDDEAVEVIYAEAFDDSGIGRAIMNRLLKAAGHRVHLV